MLHRRTNFEVRRPSRSVDMIHFGLSSNRPWPLTFWFWNWCALLFVAWATYLSYLPILLFLGFFVLDLWANTCQTDHVSSSHDLWLWRPWRWPPCGSSCCICVSSLKSVGQWQAPLPPRSRSLDAFDRCWPISQERNVLEILKLVGRLPAPRAIIRTSFKVKAQRWKSLGRLMLRPEVRVHIFRTERPTNLKLGTQIEYEDPYRRQVPWPPRSKVKVSRSLDASERCSR